MARRLLLPIEELHTYTVIGGVPARFIRNRFLKETDRIHHEEMLYEASGEKIS